MNLNLKLTVLTIALSLTLGTTGISLAAPPPDHGPKGGPQQEGPRHKISRERAIQIALSKHRRAKIVSVTISDNVYTVILAAREGKFIVEIGANTGRVLKDRPQPPKPGRPGR